MNATSNQATTSPRAKLPRRSANPWVQLIIGIICMACVANLQYGWTLFVNPIDAKFHWGRAAIQVAFTIFVLIETWLVPVEGYLVDRFGPRWVVLGGGVLVGIAWLMNSSATSLPVLYFAAAIGGIGTGCVYGTCVGNALKWFPGRRGIAAGLHRGRVRCGRGAHHRADFANDRLRRLRARVPGIRAHAGRHRVRDVLAAARAAAAAPGRAVKAAIRPRTATAPSEVLRSPVFYVLYVMFVMIAAGGLTMAASMAPIAEDFKIDKVPVDLFGVHAWGHWCSRCR